MTTTLNRNSAVPLYLQLADELRHKIVSGEWQPEQRIPSENELNQIYSISRMTIRQVLGKLVDEGLVFRVHGKGTFVAQRKIATRSPSYYGVREQLEAQGYSTRTATLVSEVVEADDRLARALRDGATDGVDTLGRGLVERGLSIPPRLTLRPGLTFRIILNRDLDLVPYGD